MASPYGYSITAQKARSQAPGVFLSGLSFEAGRFRLIIPLRAGDFVPVWRTEAEALAAVRKFTASAAGERFHFEAVDIRPSIEAGGPLKRTLGLFRGVDGFTVPGSPPRINPATRHPYD